MRARGGSTGWHRGAKRGLDLLLTAPLLVLVSPLLVVCWVAVRVADPGPALFRQARGGADQRSFRICKFRTMRLGAAPVPVQVSWEDPDSRYAWESSRRSSHDPRLIPVVGSALRRSSLDELPQLWNVLRGDMSLVGPRPLELDVLAMLPGELVSERSRVRPGVTGPWQVSGRSDLSLDRMLELDAAYVRCCTLRLDLSIMARTPLAVLSRRGAY